MQRRFLGRRFGLGALLLLALQARVAHAEEKVRLVYVRGTGAEVCPPELELRLWVMARLGYDPFSPRASRAVLTRVVAADGGLQGSVEVVDANGQSAGRRELTAQAERCQELARAMALSISLAIDPERASQPAPAQPPAPARAASPAPQSRRQSQQPGAAPVLRDRATRPSAGPRLFASVAVASSVGALPGLAFGATSALGLQFQSFTLAAEGLALQSIGMDLSPRGRLSGALIGPGLGACWLRQRLMLCGVAIAALQRLDADGVAVERTSSGLYVGIGPRAALHLPLGDQFAGALGLQGLFNLTPNSAGLSGVAVWTAPLVSATLSIGLETHFL